MIAVSSILDKRTVKTNFFQLSIFLKCIDLLNGYLDIQFHHVTITIIKCIK